MKEGRWLIKKMYSGECVGNWTTGGAKKRWILSVKECLMERTMKYIEAKRIVWARPRDEHH